MEIITSRANEGIKEAVKLKSRSFREEKKLFYFEGIKLFCEALRFNLKIEKIYVEQGAFEKYEELLRPAKDGITLVSRSVYEKISDEKAYQGIFTVARFPDNVKSETDECKKGCIIADSLRDPGNAGTVIRTAAALGIERVIFGSDCADIFSSKTVRASMGAVFCTDIVVTRDLEKAILQMREKDCKVYAAMLSDDAKSIKSNDFPDGFSVVIGNEGHGVSASVANVCDGYVKIPQTDRAESLNAANAAAIFMWEMSNRAGEEKR